MKFFITEEDADLILQDWQQKDPLFIVQLALKNPRLNQLLLSNLKENSALYRHFIEAKIDVRELKEELRRKLAEPIFEEST